MTPIIGITFSSCYIENGPNNNYIRAVEEHGGTVRRLYPGVSDSEFADINGLLLTGGPDIAPRHYDEKRHETTDIHAARDALELPLFEWAMEKDLPVFGICRGIQVMSVGMDGSLYQDIPSQFKNHLTHKIVKSSEDAWHDIQIQSGSLLNQITGENIANVNSRHHQAVKVIGGRFLVTAQSKDGIIEAIEDRSKQFMLGVQYHPERMHKRSDLDREHAQKLFTAFIDACS